MNSSLSQSTPILPSPYRLRGTGTLRLRGAGEIVLDLDGKGRVELAIRGDVVFHLEGEAGGRIARPGETVFLAARGSLSIHGSEVDVRFSGGAVRALVLGGFEAFVDGRGEIDSPRGGRIGWGLHPRTLRLERGAAIDASAPPSSGAAA